MYGARKTGSPWGEGEGREGSPDGEMFSGLKTGADGQSDNNRTD